MTAVLASLYTNVDEAPKNSICAECSSAGSSLRYKRESHSGSSLYLDVGALHGISCNLKLVGMYENTRNKMRFCAHRIFVVLTLTALVGKLVLRLLDEKYLVKKEKMKRNLCASMPDDWYVCDEYKG